MSTLLNYSTEEVIPYIDWVYFYHAWGFQPQFAGIATAEHPDAWLDSFSEPLRPKAREALQLLDDARRLLASQAGNFRIRSLFCLCTAYSDGDDLLLDGIRLPLLRQQTRRNGSDAFLCLSDFVRPLSAHLADTVGVFATSVSLINKAESSDDPYISLLLQTLCDRLAEAATELMHCYVRREAWGYAPNEQLTVAELLAEKYQGIRPAVGYPSLPDQSINFILDHLLHFHKIGITLTENGAMSPHSSVSGLMLSHSQARYFGIGKIGQDQLEDYARRRGLPVENMRKFLAAVL